MKFRLGAMELSVFEGDRIDLDIFPGGGGG